MRIRKREFMWAVLAAGLAGMWIYRRWRRARAQAAALEQSTEGG